MTKPGSTKDPLPIQPLKAYVPTELLTDVRQKLGGTMSTSAAVRLGLALVAGLDPNDYRIRPAGRPRKAAA